MQRFSLKQEEDVVTLQHLIIHTAQHCTTQHYPPRHTVHTTLHTKTHHTHTTHQHKLVYKCSLPLRLHEECIEEHQQGIPHRVLRLIQFILSLGPGPTG